MKYIKKNWSNILFVVFIILMIIPQTRMPIQVFIQRIISFSPSEIDSEEQEILDDYHFNLKTLSSESINFTRSEGKVVLVNFWATWCPPCIAEMPDLQELYHEYKDQVDFYFISSEETEKLKDFLVNKGYDIPVYRQMGRAPDLLESRSLPTTFLISSTGKIIIRKTGAANWNSEKVHNVLDKLLYQ